EQMYASLMRSLQAKLNVNIVTAGPLAVYRKSALDEIGGFNTKGYSEDTDVTIRLLKAGYIVEFAEKAFTNTNMPTFFKGFIRQRTRFVRGTVNILQRHLKADHSLFRIYTLPLTFFDYLQAVIMGSITIISIVTGYYTYFASQHVYFSKYVLG